jgi:hypothetical protein
MRPPRSVLLACAAACLLLPAAAPAGELLDSFDVAPGLKYARHAPEGLVAHVLKFDLRTKGLQLRSLKSRGKETVRQLVERVNAEGDLAVAAINGDFFRQETAAGLPYGIQVSDGHLAFPPMRRSMVAFRANNEPWIGITTLRARLTFAPKANRGPAKNWTVVDDVNPLEEKIRGGSGIYLFTPAFQGVGMTRPGGVIAVLESIQPALQVGDVCEGTVARLEASDKPVKVPEAGGLIAFFGESARAVARAVKPGQGVAVQIELPPLPAGAVTQAIGGGPRLIRDGKVQAEIDKEDFDPAHAMEISKRHPRSAIGYDKAKQNLFLVMVEGRHADSEGMTFGELGKFLSQLGCYQAMAFDGGGSAAMYVATKGMVSLSMGGFGQPENREIANALLITMPKGLGGKKAALKPAPAAPAPAGPASPAAPKSDPLAPAPKAEPKGQGAPGGKDAKPWDP